MMMMVLVKEQLEGVIVMVGGTQYAVNAVPHLFAIRDEGDEDRDCLMFFVSLFPLHFEEEWFSIVLESELVKPFSHMQVATNCLYL